MRTFDLEYCRCQTRTKEGALPATESHMRKREHFNRETTVHNLANWWWKIVYQLNSRWATSVTYILLVMHNKLINQYPLYHESCHWEYPAVSLPSFKKFPPSINQPSSRPDLLAMATASIFFGEIKQSLSWIGCCKGGNMELQACLLPYSLGKSPCKIWFGQKRK